MRSGLSGWVRNNPDGTVEIAAAGEVDALERLEQQIRHGPPGARVDQVAISDDAASALDAHFAIR